jgi:hypothetical protein
MHKNAQLLGSKFREPVDSIVIATGLNDKTGSHSAFPDL